MLKISLPNSLLLTAIVLVATLLRLLHLTSGTIWLDEGYTVLLAKLPFAQVLSIGALDANPPLGNTVYGVWTRLFGWSEISFQLVSPLFGVATILVFYLFVKELFNRQTALIAAFLLAISPVHISYSQFIRIYSFALFFQAVLLWLVARFLKNRARTTLIGISLATLVLLNTHYFALLAVTSLGLAVWPYLRESRPLRKETLCALLIVTVAFLPTGRLLLSQYSQHQSFSWISAPSLTTLGSCLTAIAGSPTLLIMLTLAAATFTLHTIRNNQERHQLHFLAVTTFGPILLALLLSYFGKPFLHPRYAVFSVAPFLAFAARGLSLLPVPALCACFLPLIAISSSTELTGYYLSRGNSATLKQEFQFVDKNYAEGDLVLHTSKCTAVPALLYLQPQQTGYLLKGAATSNLLKATGSIPELETSALKDLRRVWVFDQPCLGSPPGSTLLDSSTLSRLGFTLNYHTTDNVLSLYTTSHTSSNTK